MAHRDANLPVPEFNGIRWAYDRSEIIADSIVNGIGVVLALVGATVLIVYATLWSSHGALAALVGLPALAQLVPRQSNTNQSERWVQFYSQRLVLTRG